jgi:hypothetical protein
VVYECIEEERERERERDVGLCVYYDAVWCMLTYMDVHHEEHRICILLHRMNRETTVLDKVV